MSFSWPLLVLLTSTDPVAELPLPPAPPPTRVERVDWRAKDRDCCQSSRLSLIPLGTEGCWARVGDLDLGRAPFFRKEVPAGRCVARVQCDDGRRWSGQVTLRPGMNERVLIRGQDWEQSPTTSRLSVLVLGETDCTARLGELPLGAVPFFNRSVPEGLWMVRVQCRSGHIYKRRVELLPDHQHRLMLGSEEWESPPTQHRPGES